MQYIQACLLTKQNFVWCFDAGLEHMAGRSRGNGTNFDWLRKSCGIRTCDMSLDGNPEKYGRPMKSAITSRNKVQNLLIRRIYFYIDNPFELPLYCYSKFLKLFQLGQAVEISDEAYACL